MGNIAAGAIIFYILLFISKIIPTWLSLWGMIASFLLIFIPLGTYFETLSMIGSIAVLPIILNELLLAFWLMIIGFKSDIIK